MEQNYVDALKNDDFKSIKELYNSFRNEFFTFSKKYNIAQEDIPDLYQESFLAIRKHAISGKLYEVNSSFKTYLFGIGKHFIFKKLNYYKSKKHYEASHHNPDDYAEITAYQHNEMTEEQKLLRYYFKQLGKSCRQMLTLSFYRGLTNEEIATLEGYDSEAVVRSQKSRCLKTLKNLIKTSNPRS